MEMLRCLSFTKKNCCVLLELIFGVSSFRHGVLLCYTDIVYSHEMHAIGLRMLYAIITGLSVFISCLLQKKYVKSLKRMAPQFKVFYEVLMS